MWSWQAALIGRAWAGTAVRSIASAAVAWFMLAPFAAAAAIIKSGFDRDVVARAIDDMLKSLGGTLLLMGLLS